MRTAATSQLPTLAESVQEFLLDRQIRSVSDRTLEWHNHCLTKWLSYCAAHGIEYPTDVTTHLLRQYILHLQGEGHNEGGVHTLYRSLRTFLLWCETEFEPPGWKSPTRKVKVSAPSDEALDPIPLDDFASLVATCQRRTFAGDRDRAILYTLLDTGVRRQELADLALADVDLQAGTVLVRRGKGGKPRTVFLGANSRRTLMQYLRLRPKHTPALWVSDAGEPLTNDGIRSMIRRRAALAHIPEPGLHSFRRAFAIGYLRNGGDVLTLQRLLGHASLDIINRYVKHVSADIAAAHRAHGVVDRL